MQNDMMLPRGRKEFATCTNKRSTANDLLLERVNSYDQQLLPYPWFMDEAFLSSKYQIIALDMVEKRTDYQCCYQFLVIRRSL